MPSNYDVGHQWANKAKTTNSGSHFSFNNGRLYSYSTLIANIIEGKETVCFITSNSCSQSTSTHVGIADTCNWHPTIRCYRVPDSIGDTESHTRNIDIFRTSMLNAMQKLAKARNKIKAFDIVTELQDNFKKYIAFFGLKVDKLTEIFLTDNIEDQYNALDAANTSIIKKRKAAQERTRKAYRNNLVKQHEDSLKLFRDHKTSYVAALDERPYQYLRISANGKKIETSHEFSFTIAQGKQLYATAKKIANKGGCEDCSEKFLKHYQIRSITNDSIIIGCHKVLFAEADQVAKQLGW